MKIYEFTTELSLPCPVDQVFGFFSDAGNLQAITPPWVNFEILTPRPFPMRAGALIDYRLRIHGFPLKWRTEITAWDPPNRFVDEQRRGPYRLWIHEHRFFQHGDQTVCTDHVRYAVPGGALVHRLFVRRDVEKIFAFRQRQLRKIFDRC